MKRLLILAVLASLTLACDNDQRPTAPAPQVDKTRVIQVSNENFAISTDGARMKVIIFQDTQTGTEMMCAVAAGGYTYGVSSCIPLKEQKQ